MAYYNPVTTIASVGSQTLPVPVTIASPTEPTTRPNGGDLRQGDVWFQSTNGYEYLFIDNEGVSGGKFNLVGVGDSVVYTLPAASTTTLGGIRVGNALQINTAGQLSVKPAAADHIGGVSIGGGLNVTGTGFLSVANAPVLNPGRMLWGQYFNGSADISGNMTGVGTITASTSMVLKAGADSGIFFRCNSTGNNYVFNKSDGSATGNLKFENLTSSHNYFFPDKQGTIAMTSDITITLDTLKSVVAASTDFADFKVRIAAL